MLARDVMTTPVISVTPATRTRDAIELMLAHHLSGLPVLDDEGKLIGILSEGDLIRRSELGTEKHRSRFIAFLLGPGRAAHDYTKSHARFVRGVMTQEVIANMVGGRRESVTVAAGHLQDVGLIHYSRGHIKILDREGLEKVVCECYKIVNTELNRLIGTSRRSDLNKRVPCREGDGEAV